MSCLFSLTAQGLLKNGYAQEDSNDLEAIQKANQTVTRNYFQGQQGDKSNHRQATIEEFCVGSKPSLRFTHHVHFGFDGKVVHFALVIDDATTLHFGPPFVTKCFMFLIQVNTSTEEWQELTDFLKICSLLGCSLR